MKRGATQPDDPRIKASQAGQGRKNIWHPEQEPSGGFIAVKPNHRHVRHESPFVFRWAFIGM